MEHKGYYTILGVSRIATPGEIKAAYRKLSRKYHPFFNRTPEAKEKRREIKEAYNVLSNQRTRDRYDLGLDLYTACDSLKEDESFAKTKEFEEFNKIWLEGIKAKLGEVEDSSEEVKDPVKKAINTISYLLLFGGTLILWERGIFNTPISVIIAILSVVIAFLFVFPLGLADYFFNVEKSRIKREKLINWGRIHPKGFFAVIIPLLLANMVYAFIAAYYIVIDLSGKI